MGRHSVVSSNEIVIISRCPACDGMVFCCLERFMQEEDRGLLDDLADRGYWIDSFSLSRMPSRSRCRCRRSPAEALVETAAAVQGWSSCQAPSDTDAGRAMPVLRRVPARAG